MTFELRHRITAGRLPTSVYDLLADGQPVGYCQIRHTPSHSPGIPPEYANHVYYEVRPDMRRRGYGTELLRLALIEAGKLGLKEIFINADVSDVASVKIIEANGGEFVRTFATLNTGEEVRFYRIDLGGTL
jgi:predicted acetyltransferase